MIKILRIINRFNLGGPTYNAAYLTKYMPPEYQTLLIGGVPAKSETDSLHIVKSLNIDPIVVPEMSRSIHPLNDLKAYLKIKKIIREYRPDIVHTHASKAGLLGRLAAAQQNVPVIVHTFHGHVFHSYFNPALTNIFIQTERWLAKKTSALIAISPQQKHELIHQYKIAPAEKFIVIPLGLDLKKFSENKLAKRNLFRQKHNIPENIIAIGIIGRLAPVKNHQLLIDAVKTLKQQTNKTFEIIIIGDGETRNQLKEYIIQSGMTYRENPQQTPADFYFTSWIKEMDTAYAGLDIVALSSRNEGTPVSLLEAQAAGKTIVSTNVGGVRDIVMKGSGYIVNDFSAESYARALHQSIENYAVQNTFIENHISPLIIEKYAYSTLVKNMDNLYKQLLSSNRQ